MHIRTIIGAFIASLTMATMSLADWGTELTAIGGASDFFGQSIALDGDTCVIGAPNANSFVGSAYVFTNTNGTWSQVQELTATGGAEYDQFGFSVALDGDTCVIGAWGTNSNTGSAYVFTNTNGTWSQIQKLTASDGASGDNFGSKIAIDVASADRGQWNQHRYRQLRIHQHHYLGQTVTHAPDGASGDFFGTSVALDGDTCVIGAMGTNSETGSAYVFEYVDTLDEWIQWGPALTANGGETSGHFGFSVALDGDTCVIGANLTNTNAGSAYVFTNTGETWTQAVELTATDGADNDYFGFSVALDGNTCVIGANGTDSIPAVPTSSPIPMAPGVRSRNSPPPMEQAAITSDLRSPSTVTPA